MADAVKVIALAGNPNVGKSTVFNALTGLRQHTGNWPGKTVAGARGAYTRNGLTYEIVDLPGCYSLYAQSAEEEITRDFLKQSPPDAVIVVCDASCLERNLILVVQVLNITQRVAVCVNLADEAERKGISVDYETLSSRLGVPVTATAAREGRGLDALMEAAAAVANDGADVSGTVVANDRAGVSGALIDLSEPSGLENTIEQASANAGRAAALFNEIVSVRDENYSAKDRMLDRVFAGRRMGFPLMIAALAAVFWLTLSGANYPSELLGGALFSLEPKLAQLLMLINAPPFFVNMLTQGVYRVLAWVVSVMLPPMAIFFPLFTCLEDCGYLPRVAFNLDKIFKSCSACGKQALTMCMGFGCNAAGVVGCRIINSPRERLIAVITNNFAPCNGRFPALIALIAMFFTGAGGIAPSFLSAVLLTGVVIIGVLMTFAVSKLLSVTLLKGVPSSFVLELPPYRKPQIGKVIVRSVLDRAFFVLARAAAVAAPAGAVIWLAANVRIDGETLLAIFSAFLEPFGRLLGMDGVILLAFILGWPANEIVIPIIIMAYISNNSMTGFDSLPKLKSLLVENGWDAVTAISVMLFMLMHWPCSTTCLSIKKETRSIKWTLAAVAIPTISGVLICFVFNAAARLILGR